MHAYANARTLSSDMITTAYPGVVEYAPSCAVYVARIADAEDAVAAE